MFEWLKDLPESVWVAFVGGIAGAVTAIVTMLLKELLLSRLTEKREERRKRMAVYRAYAEPLAVSATSLMWRMREILIHPRRGGFLLRSDPAHPFDEYKWRSTLYRTAALLGWIRAYRRELSFLPLEDRPRLESITQSLGQLEKALADGIHVERKALSALADLWGIGLPQDEERCSELAAHATGAIQRGLHSEGVATARGMASEKQCELCSTVAKDLCARLDTEVVSEDIIRETRARAVRAMDVREAYLYRDWQAGIGDCVIEKTQRGDRCFDVIGYAAFEEIIESTDGYPRRWIGRLERLFEDVDVSGRDAFDVRVEQLRNVLSAVAQLVVALREVKSPYSIISKETLDVAKVIVSGDSNNQTPIR